MVEPENIVSGITSNRKFAHTTNHEHVVIKIVES